MKVEPHRGGLERRRRNKDLGSSEPVGAIQCQRHWDQRRSVWGWLCRIQRHGRARHASGRVIQQGRRHASVEGEAAGAAAEQGEAAFAGDLPVGLSFSEPLRGSFDNSRKPKFR